jgi:hypothetical protein
VAVEGSLLLRLLCPRLQVAKTRFPQQSWAGLGLNKSFGHGPDGNATNNNCFWTNLRLTISPKEREAMGWAGGYHFVEINPTFEL